MPTSYNYFKEQVKDWIIDNVPLNYKILDVGAGCGTYHDLLRPYGYQRIDAVEVWKPYIDEYNLKEKYDYVHNKNILDVSSNYLESYDLVILGDVLEHLNYVEATNLLSKIENFIVAVPYKMEQGEVEGNVYETHLQPDLTIENISEKYPNLELLYGNEFYGYYIKKKPKHEKAFIVYADDSYFDLLDICCRSIRNYSNIPILVYMLNSEKKLNIVNTTTIKWKCNVTHLNKRNDYINREDKQIYKLLIERPKIVKHALENYAEIVAYVDTDSIATINVNKIFDYFPTESNYPYFTRGIYDFLIVNGRGGATDYNDLSTTLEAPACELFKSEQELRIFAGYRQTGYFVAGQNCIDFLAIWYHRCNHPLILKDNAKYAPFNEETILQTLLYDYKVYAGLPYCYINGLHYELEYKDHEYFLKDWVKVPLKENHLFYHGEKDINKLNQFNENIIPSTTP